MLYYFHCGQTGRRPYALHHPDSSPSLFFHFVIFLLIQKGSETDNFLLCYDDHTKEKKKDEKEEEEARDMVDTLGEGTGVFS